MNYKIYYRISEIDYEYKYATTVRKELLNKVIVECFGLDLVELLIIEHSISQNMDNPIPYFFGTNLQYKYIMMHQFNYVKPLIKTKNRGPKLKKVG